MKKNIAFLSLSIISVIFSINAKKSYSENVAACKKSCENFYTDDTVSKDGCIVGCPAAAAFIDY